MNEKYLEGSCINFNDGSYFKYDGKIWICLAGNVHEAQTMWEETFVIEEDKRE